MIDAVLFDLGNTLVTYYRTHEFYPILERCVEAVPPKCVDTAAQST